jgi:hypothetical protein
MRGHLCKIYGRFKTLERISVPTVEHEISFTKLSKNIRDHYERHKFAYGLGAGVALAGITYLIMRGSIARGGIREGFNARGGLTNTASFNFSNKPMINITTVLDREGRGHPGWPVRNLEFNRIFFSQKEAADTFGIPEGVLSGHLTGKFTDADGLHFERVNLVPAA